MKEKIMKKVFVVLLGVLMFFAVVAGGNKEAAAEKLRIGLILPSTVDDMAWSQSMVEGLKALQKKMGESNVEIAISEKLGKAVDAGAAARQYASQGFDIVIAHGSQFQSVLPEIAKDFPKTTFAYGTGFQTAPNIFAYDPQAQDGGYLLGMLAAKMTKSGEDEPSSQGAYRLYGVL
jgi:basic membrane protein A